MVVLLSSPSMVIHILCCIRYSYNPETGVYDEVQSDTTASVETEVMSTAAEVWSFARTNNFYMWIQEESLDGSSFLVIFL